MRRLPDMALSVMKMMRMYLVCLLIAFCSASSVLAAQTNRFACNGKVEEQVWDLWGTQMHSHVRNRLLQDRLIAQGDTYALYDFQMHVANAAAMAHRCNRQQRLMEIAGLIRIAYGELQPGSLLSPGRKWICRGGRVCNEKNRLRNTEVMLVSVQFLGLASAVANALATTDSDDHDTEQFIADTIRIAIEHLQRWGDDGDIRKIREAAAAKVDDVDNGSSAFFFTDKHLWMITIYAELAGLLKAQDRQGKQGKQQDRHRPKRIETDSVLSGKHFKALLEFFSSRISIHRDAHGRLGKAELADLDRGYWRFYADNRYAGYDRPEKPVVCIADSDGPAQAKLEVRVPPKEIRPRNDIGWDLSHARRLVPALDALIRNRQDIASVFSIDIDRLPDVSLAKAFANTLVAKVWNGNEDKPLFSNYWSGANGWYRVAYDNGTGQCREGYPPYGMSDAFLTGGYITWARYRPEIGMLGARLYALINSDDNDDRAFVARHYRSLSDSASAQTGMLVRFMFLPTLVDEQPRRSTPPRKSRSSGK